MNIQEQREYLIRCLLSENGEYSGIKIPKDSEGQRVLLRSLFNVREPKPVSEEFLKVQDEYLQERNAEKGIVRVSDLHWTNDNLTVWQGDITRLECDAIVNAANSALLGCFRPMHTCIDNTILVRITQMLHAAMIDF